MDDEQGAAEIPLTGGNMDPVVRVGDTVRRVAGDWTPAVHALLAAARAAGIEEVPVPLGIDESGREVLSYLEGVMLVDTPAEVQWSTAVLEQAGRLLRRVHEASLPLAHDRGRTWRMPAHEPVEVVCHNDVAPYNLVVTGGRVVGLIDFDLASPGPRLRDLAYLAYRIAPFAEDAEGYAPAVNSDGEEPVDRVRRLVRAYGGEYTVDEVLRAAADRLDELARFTDDRAEATGRDDFVAHAGMYRRDAARLRAMS